MNVLNRNMFRNRDSRNRLAQMGGILSSSPELQETAMTFANGGGADLPDYIINVPGLTAEGEYLRISSATLEKLNNAVPEVMANARMVSPVDMVISEGFSSLVANARPGDAVVGTRVNRLREQRAAETDPSRVPMPPEIPQGSSAAEVFAGATRNNLRNPNTTPYSETDQRIKADEVRRAEAALLESLAPNNAQGQPGGILGAKYPEGRGSYSTSIAEALLNNDPFSGELSPSQTARNQETLIDTLRREEIAQQREDSTEAGRIMRDAADTRKAFSVPLEEVASARDAIREQLAGTYSKNLAGGTDESSLETLIRKSMPVSQAKEISGDPYAGDIFSDDRIRVRPRENIGGGIEAQDAANFALESGIAKAVPTEQAAGSVSDRLKFMLEQDKLAQRLEAETESTEMTQDAAVLRSAGDAIREALTPAEELQSVTGGSSVLSSAGEAIKSLLPDEFGFQRRQRERRELAEDKRFDQTGPATKPSTEDLLEVASSILSDEQKAAIASGEISDRAKALLPPSTANELDDLFKKTIASQQEGTPGGSLPEDGTANYLTRESMAQAQRINVGMILPNGELASSVPYLLDRATGKAYRADGAPITAAEQGTVDKFLATEQGQSQLSAVTEADTAAKESTIASVQQKLIQAVQRNDVEGQIALRKKLKDAQEPTVKVEPKALVTERETGELDKLSAEMADSQRTEFQEEREQEGDREVVSPPVPDATASEKVLAAIESQPEPDSDADEIFKEGVSSPVTTEIKRAAVDAGMGEKFGGDGSIADLTKDYTKLLKSLLGESDEDKAARKGELFMLMGAALMSGKSSNALTNIGDALQIGAKAAIQDRATRKKREDTIGLKGFEMAADRIAKSDAAQLVLDKEGRAEQRRLKAVAAQNKERRAFETWKLSQKQYFGSAPYKAVDASFKALLKAGRDSTTIDLVSGEKPRDYALRKLSELFEPDNIALYLSTIDALPAGTDGGGGQTDGGGFKVGG